MTLSLPSALAAATRPSMPPKSAADVAVFGSPPPPPAEPVASLIALDMADEPSLIALDPALDACDMALDAALVMALAAEVAALPALEPALPESEPQAVSVRVTTARPAITQVPTRAERT